MMKKNFFPSSWRNLALTLFLGAVLVPTARGTEFNDQVMGRVIERLEDFMNVPVDACQRLSNYRAFGGFPNSMVAVDRDQTLRRVYAEIRTMVYYGLEDGMFLFYNAGRNAGSYREPVSSGYDGINVPEDMEKYWNTCVNRQTGELEQCIMEEGAPYVQCVEDCKVLDKCPDEKSQQDCSMLEGEEKTTCQDQVKWCPQYTIESAPATGETRGFVPRTYHCIDPVGQFEEEPGNVLLDAGTGELGDCFYGDGVTPVKRSLAGAYAYCGGNGAVCDNTYLGGYRSRDYDPRYRGWYKLSKLEQKPVWTEPYPFFTNLEMGITYTQPIYSTQDDKTVFDGVLAVDYLLVKISDFLQAQYKDSDILVIIVEDAEPHYVIATSTGSKSAGTVLADDPTQPCPDDSSGSTNLCRAIRFSVNDLKESPDDAIIRRAFEAHSARGFPDGEFVTSKAADGVGSAAYISQGQVYEQANANLKWRVIVTMPVAKSDEDAALKGNNVFAIVCLLGGLGAFLCFYLFLVFYSKRTEPAVINADWRFTCAFLLGCSVLNTSTFTLLGPNTDEMCMLRMWSFNALFACAVSPLFIKVWRMYKLFTASGSFRRVSVTHFQAFLRTIPIALAELVLLAIFSIFDPPKQREELEVNGGTALQHLYCDQDTRGFFWAQVLFDGLLVLFGCVLAFLTRDLDPKFGEAKQLGLAMYNIAFTGIIIIAILQVVDMTQSGKIILQAIGILWGTLFSATAFVLPRLIESVQAPVKPKKHVYGSADHGGGKWGLTPSRTAVNHWSSSGTSTTNQPSVSRPSEDVADGSPISEQDESSPEQTCRTTDHDMDPTEVMNSEQLPPGVAKRIEEPPKREMIAPIPEQPMEMVLDDLDVGDGPSGSLDEGGTKTNDNAAGAGFTREGLVL